VTQPRRKKGCLARLVRLLLMVLAAWAGVWWWQQSQHLAALERRRDELRDRLSRARAADPRLAQVPDADILIGLPVGFATTLAQQLTRGLLDQVEIALHDIAIHKEGVVSAKLLVGTIHPGRYVLDVMLHEASVLLEPGAPQVAFEGRRLGIGVPVSVAQGHGTATLKLDWDSRGLGSVVCDDFSLSQEVGARIVPRSYDVQGAFVLSVEGEALVARPDFPAIVLRVGIEPDASAWKAVEDMIQKRSWKCQAVLRKIDVQRLLRERLEQGFEVRIPERVFKPFRLPASVQQSVAFEGRTYALAARFSELRLTPQILWYGAKVELGAAAPAPTPPPDTEERN